MCNFEGTILHKSGDDGIEVTLLPIPNRTVKVYSADGTAWETVWKSRTSPDILVCINKNINKIFEN